MNKLRNGMEALADWLNPKVMMAVWLVMSVVWLALLVPSLLWWKESVAWIVIMSWWANVAASMACFVAAHGNKDDEQLHADVAQIKLMLEAGKGWRK